MNCKFETKSFLTGDNFLGLDAQEISNEELQKLMVGKVYCDSNFKTFNPGCCDEAVEVFMLNDNDLLLKCAFLDGQ